MSDLAAAQAAANGKAAHDADIKALIRSSRRAEKTVPICLRGDLVAEFEELDRALAATAAGAAAQPNDKRLNNTAIAEGQRLAEAMAALQEQMRAATVVFRLRALGPRWVALRLEHPPRKGEDGKVLDEDSMGINAETFFEPLMRESIVYPPELDDETWELLMGRGVPTEEDPEADQRGLSEVQKDLLAGAAWLLNRQDVDIPFSRAASRILQNSSPE